MKPLQSTARGTIVYDCRTSINSSFLFGVRPFAFFLLSCVLFYTNLRGFFYPAFSLAPEAWARIPS